MNTKSLEQPRVYEFEGPDLWKQGRRGQHLTVHVLYSCDSAPLCRVGKIRHRCKMKRRNKIVIHNVSYASQPDLLIDCDQTWTTPAWGACDWSEPNVTVPNGVFKTLDKRYYTFDDHKVTCEACISKKQVNHT